MNEEKTTKRVVRLFMAWNDQKEQRWLEAQARSGWHVKSMNAFGYTLERGAPADVAYRLDFSRGCRRGRDEYLALFGDAGWEHLGNRGPWHLFRKPVTGGEIPEIYTDAQSRIAMYRRVIVLLGAMLALITSQTGSRIAAGESLVLWFQLAAISFLLYGIVRLMLVINRLKRGQAQAA